MFVTDPATIKFIAYFKSGQKGLTKYVLPTFTKVESDI